jgi:SAM-dependent methyltransferase
MNPKVNEERWRIAQKHEKEHWEQIWKKDFEKRTEVAKSYWDFHSKILEEFIHIERKRRVLKIGCGATPFISYITKCEKYALDPLMNYYTSNFEISEEIERIKGIGEAIPLPNDYFDVVITTNTLDHVKNPSKVLSEINRILKKRGLLYLTVNCHTPLVKNYKIVKELLGVGDKFHPHSFSIKNIRRSIENSVLKVRSTRKGIGDLGVYTSRKLLPNDVKKISNSERGLVITKVLSWLGSKFSKEEEGMDFIFVASK